MKKWIKKMIAKLFKWSTIGEVVTRNEVFNSIRINVLISQLVKNGVIKQEEYDSELADTIYKMLKNRGDRNGKFQRV